MTIQWYPGHMTKTKRMIQANLRLVDVVVEMLDARIPYSSKNPDIDGLAQNKKRIVVLNKAGLANERLTKAWQNHYESRGFSVVSTDCIDGKGVSAVVTAAKKAVDDKRERLKAKGRVSFTTRAMILGIPNVGKSSLINKIAKKNAAQTADRPGVTRDKQWIRVDNDLELLDTPGVLWPKFDEEVVGVNLAITGAIKDDILDTEQLAKRLIASLIKLNPDILSERYKLEAAQSDADEVLLNIGTKRGFLIKGGEIDELRTAVMLLDEFRAGKLGRVSLETP